MAAGSFRVNMGGNGNEGKNHEPNVPDEPEEYQGLLKVASDQVPFGVYAVEKDGYAELRKDKCRSVTELKALTRGFKSQGFRVLANRQVNADGGEKRV